MEHALYDGERFRRQAIDGMLNQTYGDLAFHVIDAGCTDATAGILDRYKICDCADRELEKR